jgi:hypothetical protein
MTLSLTSNTRSNPEVDLDSDSDSESYADPDTDPDTLSDIDSEQEDLGINPHEELGTKQDTRRDLEVSSNAELDAAPDSEAEEILGNISRFREEGPARPKHTDQTKKLWRTESGFWTK